MIVRDEEAYRRSNDLNSKIASHDRHIDRLTHTMADLADTSTRTNATLEKLVDNIGIQNVLVEKFANMDANITEGFKRRDDRLDKLEAVQDGEGCASLAVTKFDIKCASTSAADSATRIDSLETESQGFVRTSGVKWAIGILVGLAALGVGVSDHHEELLQKSIQDIASTITAVDKDLSNHEHKMQGTRSAVIQRLDRIEIDINSLGTDVNKLKGATYGHSSK